MTQQLETDVQAGDKGKSDERPSHRGLGARAVRSVLVLALALAGGTVGWRFHSWWTAAESLEAIEPLVARQDWTAAQRLLNRYLARHPEDPGAVMLLGRVLAGRGAYQRSAELLEQMPPGSRQYAEALWGAGQARLAIHQRRRAERVWNACGTLHPISAEQAYYQQECRRALCGIYALEQREAEFKTASWEMMEFEGVGNRHDVLFARTRFEFEKMDPQGAVAQLQLALTADPDDVFARRAIGLYQLEIGELQAARAHLARCVQEAPDQPIMWDAWLKCLYSAGDLSGLAEAVAQMPERFAAPDYRSIVAEHQGNLNRAIEFAKQSIEAEPGKAEAHYRLGHLQARAGNEASAQEHLARSTALKKEMDNLHDAYDAYRDLRARTAEQRADLASRFGQAYENLGHRDEAMAWYRAALAEDPRHETSSVRLQRLESIQVP